MDTNSRSIVEDYVYKFHTAWMDREIDEYYVDFVIEQLLVESPEIIHDVCYKAMGLGEKQSSSGISIEETIWLHRNLARLAVDNYNNWSKAVQSSQMT